MSIKAKALKSTLILSVVTAFMLPQMGMAHSHKGHKKFKKGICKEVKCRGLEGEALQSCKEEKKACMQAHFNEKLETAEKDGISAEKKDKWVKKLEKRVAFKEKKGASSEDLVPLKERIERVKALKESKN